MGNVNIKSFKGTDKTMYLFLYPINLNEIASTIKSQGANAIMQLFYCFLKLKFAHIRRIIVFTFPIKSNQTTKEGTT